MKTKIKFLKVQTAIIMLFLSVLGFSSCQKEKCKCSCPAKYKSDCKCYQTDAEYGVLPPHCFTFPKDNEITGEPQPISNNESN